MNAMSMSFVMGRGSVEHNLRKTKGNGVRQNGVLERRFLNEYGVTDGTNIKEITDTTNVDTDAIIKHVVADAIEQSLSETNARNIANGHPERVKTVEQWIDAQCYVRGGNRKQITSEYVIQVGNKFSGIPYEPARNADGNMLTNRGVVIPEWDTRHVPAYDDYRVKESAISKQLKIVYKEFVEEFQKRNQNATVVCYAIHGDERGGVHCHLTVLWKNRCNKGVGVAIACPTAAMRQQYEAQGIKCGNTKQNNAMTRWRKDMRALLEETCNKHGIERLDMHNTEPHRSVAEFGKFKDKYVEQKELEFKAKETELQEKELELSSDIAKQEWYILKTKHKGLYNIIHNEWLKSKKMLQKVLDRKTRDDV